MEKRPKAKPLAWFRVPQQGLLPMGISSGYYPFNISGCMAGCLGLE
jgi:hypothetical protein